MNIILHVFCWDNLIIAFRRRYEPHREKTGFLHMRKQRRRSASRLSSTYSQNFKLLAFFCDNTDLFMSDLVGNPEDRFSRVAAHIVPI